jgi:HlyD family secretion protein
MDREINPRLRRRRTLRHIITVIIAVAAIVFTFGATIEWLRPSSRRSDLQFAKVGRGTVDASVQASGILVPATEQVVSSPVEARILRVTHRPGDRVHRGDELLTLDNTATRLDLARVDDKLAQKENEAGRLELQNEEILSDLRAQLQQKRLDAEMLHLKAAQTSRLRQEGLSAEQDALLASTAARKIDIELAQLEEKIVRTARTGSAQVAALALDRRLLRKERDESNRQLDLSMMRAGRDGVVTWMLEEEGATVRRGDVLARIADLSSYGVEASISDLHAAQLAAGMPVRVQVGDGVPVRGRISRVEPRIESGVMKFHATLDDPSDRRFRSNVRVDVYPITGSRDNVLRVKRGALGQGDREEVFVVRNDALIRVPVRWGLMGQEYLEPLEGLAAGDEVVISKMNDYAGVKTLRLK